MKKFIWATNDSDDYLGIYINPNYIINFGQGQPRIRYVDQGSAINTSIIQTYWITVDECGQSMKYYIDEDTYNKLINMER